MNVQLWLEILGTSIASSTVACAVLAYLSKTLLTQQLSRELERYKAGLLGELEALKANLNKELHAFNTQFSRADQQRTSGIMEIHGLMCQIEQHVYWDSGPAATAVISKAPETRTVEALNAAWEGIAKLNNTLAFHSLLLDDCIYQGVHEWAKAMMVLIGNLGYAVESLRRDNATQEQTIEERERQLAELRDRYIEEHLPRVGALRKNLEQQFKALLGLQGSSS
jgi:hypothetical protein